MIRVGTNTIYNLNLANITKNQRDLYDTNERIVTGKSVNSISDKPDKLQTLLMEKVTLKSNEQYKENLESGLEYLTVTEDAINHAADILINVRSLVVEGSDTIGDIEWESFAQRVDQYLNEMVDIGNTKYKEKYVFGGTSTKTIPFSIAGDRNSVITNGSSIDKQWRIEVGKYQMETISVSGEEVFRGDVDIYDLFIQIRDAFTNQDSATLQSLLDELDSAQDQVLSRGARVGGIINRFELLYSQYEVENTNLRSFISDIEDADLLEESTNLKKQELALQAAMTVLSKNMNLTLVNYLK